MAFSAWCEPLKSQQQLEVINKIAMFDEQDSETLIGTEVFPVTMVLLTKPDSYPRKTVAQAFLLLANIATNQADFAKAHQYALNGLEQSPKNSQESLCLSLKLADVYIVNKNYNKLLATAQEGLNTKGGDIDSKFYLFALTYRSIAYTLLNQPQKALDDLKHIETKIALNKTLSTHIKLLDIIAKSHYYLGDYKTSLSLQLKILKIRFDINKRENVEQTYYQIGLSYQALNQLNDAYNAYWQAEKYAQEKQAPIAVAYASYRLGQTLLQQKKFLLAKDKLLIAKALFSENNLAQSYLANLSSLIATYTALDDGATAHTLLVEAEGMLDDVDFLDDIDFLGADHNLYLLLADMHFTKGNSTRAFYWQKKFINRLNSPLIATNIDEKISLKSLPLSSVSTSIKNKALAVKISKHSDSTATNNSQSEIKKSSIITLLISCAILLAVVLILWLRQHALQLHILYLEDEKPKGIILSSRQTKNFYQREYAKSRKFNYLLTVGYFSIDNWQEIVFRFNRKTVNEVIAGVEDLIRASLSEFEYAGVINKGEYLLLFPHQNKKAVDQKIEQLIETIRQCSFANLGDFTVNINFTHQTVSSLDIDPYVFLSKLCQEQFTIQKHQKSNDIPTKRESV